MPHALSPPACTDFCHLVPAEFRRRGKGTGNPGKPGKKLRLADLQAQFGVGLKEAAARVRRSAAPCASGSCGALLTHGSRICYPALSTAEPLQSIGWATVMYSCSGHCAQASQAADRSRVALLLQLHTLNHTFAMPLPAVTAGHFPHVHPKLLQVPVAQLIGMLPIPAAAVCLPSQCLSPRSGSDPAPVLCCSLASVPPL